MVKVKAQTNAKLFLIVGNNIILYYICDIKQSQQFVVVKIISENVILAE